MSNCQQIMVKEELRIWLSQVGKQKDVAITDTTPLLEQGIINSLQLMDLILFIEQLRDTAIEAEELRPGAFRDLETIYTSFFAGA